MKRPLAFQSEQISVPDAVQMTHLKPCSSTQYRKLYQGVGQAYHWVDRLTWSNAQLNAYLQDDSVNIWVMMVQGDTAGYFELKQQDYGNVEIAYLGLFQDFVGQGLGKYLLDFAIYQAWQSRAKRIWLHTCTLDHPAALPGYLKRGFQPFKQEKYWVTVPVDKHVLQNIVTLGCL